MSKFCMEKIVAIAFRALIIIGMSAHESASAEEFRELRMHGINYPNSCAIESKNIIKQSVVESDVQDSEQAWKAIDLILCAPDRDKSRKETISLFQKKVRLASEGTGEKPILKKVAVTEKLVASITAKGSAWNTDVIAEREKIVLQYFVNEGCVNSVTFFYRDSKWSIYEIGQACD